jgi:hypothetical protein
MKKICCASGCLVLVVDEGEFLCRRHGGMLTEDHRENLEVEGLWKLAVEAEALVYLAQREGRPTSSLEDCALQWKARAELEQMGGLAS